MQIELKILNKKFYKTGNLLLTNPPQDEFKLPSYQTPSSAAIDLVCTEDITIYPGETKQIHTGIAIHIGSHTDTPMKAYREHWDYAGLILPRSGLGTKGLILANTVGLIDSDYQGELLVQAWNRLSSNLDEFEYTTYEGVILEDEEELNVLELKAGDRFAQLFIVPIARAKWNVVEEFTNTTDRGTGGFGSSGND